MDTVEQRLALADLLNRMLEYDPNRRIKPLEALQHPFFAAGPGERQLPMVSLTEIELPVEENEKMTDTLGSKEHTQRPKKRLTINLAGEFDDALSLDLFPRISQRSFDQQRALSNSSKESGKAQLIRKILSTSFASQEANARVRPESTRAQSEYEAPLIRKGDSK